MRGFTYIYKRLLFSYKVSNKHRVKKRFHIRIRDYYLVISCKVSNKHMVKKSLKRFHIRIRHYYYLVIKFLTNAGLKRGFRRMYMYKILMLIIIYTQRLFCMGVGEEC